MTTLAEFYDFYDGPEGRDDQFDFYASLFKAGECEWLELGCGTGIITIELARRGFQITGIDYDESMLAIASWKLAAEDAGTQRRTAFLRADMKDFALGKPFGAVMIPANTFGYLYKLDDQSACLKRIHEHLLPNGTLVIEELHLSPERLVQMMNLRGVERTWESRVNPQTGKYTMFKDCIRWIDTVSQTITRTTWIDEVQEDGSIKRYLPGSGYFGNRNHYFTKNELVLLINKSGFKVKDVWGNFARQPFVSQSNRMIVVAERGV